ncbi:hypothetical protein FRC02_002193 [Tulasnella sp. 418]|nr:hypothetical protein FRC02_002193 [Tulasnella sp. 418]
MEVFVRNVPQHMSQNDLIRALATVLHGSNFEQFNPSGGQLNFDLTLFKDKRQRSLHRGIGALTLGSARIAQYFLSIFGGDRPQCPFIVEFPNGSRMGPIKFSTSNRVARPDVVRMITETPYIDPDSALQREELAKNLEGEIKVENVQFGWYCRDGNYSSEWDARLDGDMEGVQPVRWVAGNLVFDIDFRELRITLPIKTALDEMTPFEFGMSLAFDSIESLFSEKRVICVRFSRIEYLTVEQSPSANAILLFLSVPPSFESHPSPVMEQMMLDRAKRTRLHAFSESHARVAPYTSLALRIVLNSPEEARKFEYKASKTQFPTAEHIRVGPVNRQLFSAVHLEAVNQWAETLEWRVAFQVMTLLSSLVVDPTEILGLKASIESLITKYGDLRTAEILRLFCGRLKTLMWTGSDDDGAKTVEDCLKRATLDTTDTHMYIRSQGDDDGVFNCHHCTVTPTRMILDGPFPDQTNRVLRRYRDNNHYFLRVNFLDEEQLNFRWDRDVDGASFVRFRVGGTLRKGFTIAGRHFDFLAYSSSALREHAVWFCTPFEQDGQRVTASTIRQSLGTFDNSIYCAARYGARLSQAFTATEASVTLQAEEIIVIDDIESPDGKSVFTDGIGQISPQLNQAIIQAIKNKPGSKKRFYSDPSAWQVRIGGYKGMLACNYELQDMGCLLRKSMSKFDAPGVYDIEIAGIFTKPMTVFLNRPLVMILETLGVRAEVFIKLQDDAVEEIEHATESIFRCARLLEMHGIGGAYRVTSVLLNLKNKLNMDFVHQEASYILDDSFLNQAIEFARNHILRVMKHKARIPVKGSYTLVGVIDEHNYLKPDEVFICVRDKDEKAVYIEGQILITRSPQVHPGDVQFVNAIGKPPAGSPFVHEEFPNCVVFSAQGERSIPSMLAGGDLDGDIYNIITNKDLFPPECDSPGEYLPVAMNRLDHRCTIEDLADWVADYINADILVSQN